MRSRWIAAARPAGSEEPGLSAARGTRPVSPSRRREAKGGWVAHWDKAPHRGAPIRPGADQIPTATISGCLAPPAGCSDACEPHAKAGKLHVNSLPPAPLC